MVKIIDCDNKVISSKTLKDLLKKNSLNSFTLWIIFAKLKTNRAKAIVASDIVTRVMKKVINC